MQFVIIAEQRFTLYQVNGNKGKLQETSMPPGAYLATEGRSPNQHASWLIFGRSKKSALGAMISHLRGQRGVSIHELLNVTVP